MPLSLTPWLMVLKISFHIILLGKTLQFITRNYLEGTRMCPHVPIAPPSPHPQTSHSHGPMSHPNPAFCSWVTSVVTFTVNGHLQLLPVPSLSLPPSLQPSPGGLDHRHVPITTSCSPWPSPPACHPHDPCPIHVPSFMSGSYLDFVPAPTVISMSPLLSAPPWFSHLDLLPVLLPTATSLCSPLPPSPSSALSPTLSHPSAPAPGTPLALSPPHPGTETSCHPHTTVTPQHDTEGVQQGLN